MPQKTYFASPQRTDKDILASEIDLVSQSPIVDCLMQTIAGLFAVVDENRQIVAVNKTMLKSLGVDNASDVFGLRPGEALSCIHAHEEPGGCGTTKYCSSCGAAIAMVASLKDNAPQERICAATVKKNGEEIDLCFKVRSTPTDIDERRFLLLYMQDITKQQTWLSLEKTFFHDLNNILTGVMGSVEIFKLEDETRSVGEQLSPMLLRLKNEVTLQRILTLDKDASYAPSLQAIPLSQIERELEQLFANHPAALGKTLDIVPAGEGNLIYSDCTLLMRILTNMVTNAFEASLEGDKVKVWTVNEGKSASFLVWNSQHIPEDIQLRIFQRHFSTKTGEGRGIGTFSMKLFAEKFLEGKVDFTSSPEAGTVFRLSLTT